MEDDVEEFRQQLMSDLGDDITPAEVKRRYAPGSFGCHEAMHMALFLEGAVSRQLLEHRTILANPEWFALANRASEALADLYQAIGAVHLDTPKS